MKVAIVGTGALARLAALRLERWGHEPSPPGEAEAAFLAVEPTPDPETGEPDLGPLRLAAAAVAADLAPGAALVLISAAPVGSTRALGRLAQALRPEARLVPIFDPSLRDEEAPMGAETAHAQALLIRLHAQRAAHGVPLRFVGLETAEVMAQTAGAAALLRALWLAELTDFCAASGADAEAVAAETTRPRRAAAPSRESAEALALAARRTGAPLTLLEAGILAGDLRAAAPLTPRGGDASRRMEALWRADAAEESRATGRRPEPPRPPQARKAGATG